MAAIQSVTPGMINEVFQYIITCDIAVFGEADSSLEDLEEQWGEMDLTNDAWVARNSNESVIGYASVTGRIPRLAADLFIHSQLSPEGVEDDLMNRVLKRTNDLSSPGKSSDAIYLTGYAASVDERVKQVFERFGFHRYTTHYRMQIDFNSTIETPQWPSEFSLSTYGPSDESELFQLIESTFNWEKHAPTSIESWRNSIFRSGRYDPEFFVLVRSNGRLVGAALAYAEETGGWIRQLAVASEYQGKGLGSRLLRHMFSLFYKKNLPGVGLGVASTNEKAWQFYERVGMYRKREFIEYRKPLN